MDALLNQVKQLKQAGFSPLVRLNVRLTSADLSSLGALKEQLAALGIMPEVHLYLNTGLGENAAPEEEPDLPDQPEQPQEPGFLVQVSVSKLNCMEFNRKDKAGKPIMELVEPRIQLFSGQRLTVSAVHKAGDKDQGDGTIFATGNEKFYFVLDCPAKPEAKGLYLRQAETTKLA